ncbi:FHA domain-containing protein [Desulfatirhabdium butyrativorans]|uniref:FHA domain-containing protein n=1 Tax=Desulfatirhabdium butyrativorans TaxID=340467 RepID=UPI0004840814|nr:FHA domain-containing protein [Desulfatirhabdium butyrativorans]
MAFKRCENGHTYDPAKNNSCPYCGINDLGIKPTKIFKGNNVLEPSPSFRQNQCSTSIPTRPICKTLSNPNIQSSNDKDTIRILDERLGFDPVVGWLVCIDGPDRGRDYRIKSEKNAIGRAENMDICIRGDKAVSKEKHAVVTYNPENHVFKLIPGESRSMVFLNGNDVDMPTCLTPYDVIRLGNTKLLFIPMCGENFHWE